MKANHERTAPPVEQLPLVRSRRTLWSCNGVVPQTPVRSHTVRINPPNLKYVTNIESYDRRIQSAINIQGRKMQRRAEFLLTRALRRPD